MPIKITDLQHPVFCSAKISILQFNIQICDSNIINVLWSDTYSNRVNQGKTVNWLIEKKSHSHFTHNVLKFKQKHNLSLNKELFLLKPDHTQHCGLKLMSAACQSCMLYHRHPPQPPTYNLFSFNKCIISFIQKKLCITALHYVCYKNLI